MSTNSRPDFHSSVLVHRYPDYPLRPDGADVVVDASNVSSYIKAVVDALLETGIKAQMDAFRSAIICRKLLRGVCDLLVGDHAQSACCERP